MTKLMTDNQGAHQVGSGLFGVHLSIILQQLSNFPRTDWLVAIVYKSTDNKTDHKMFKTQVESRAAGEWFHYQVLNILRPPNFISNQRFKDKKF